MKLLQIGNESIAFQSGAFFRDLTLIIQDLRAQGSGQEGIMHKANLRIGECINKHTGITVKPNDVPYGEFAFVLLPCLGRGHVLNGREYAKFIKENFNEDFMHSFKELEKKGWIDPATSMVGGAFSEIMYDMYISHHYLLGKQFTPEEVAAIILHETGHAFTFLQFLADTLICNNVLLRAYQELTNGKPDKKVKLILTKAADDMRMKGRDWIEGVDNDEDGLVAFRVLATAVQIEPRDMDNKIYFTQDACEELADIFAARHGAGRAIITLRSKFKLESPSYGFMQGIAFSLMSLAGAALVPAIGIPLAAIGALWVVMSGTMHIQTASDMYDITTFKKTATKMRNQFIEELKQGKLPADKVKEISEGIALADRLIQENEKWFDGNAMSRFFDMFRRGKMDARASREYTDQLERLASNDLFLHAARFGAAKEGRGDGDHEYR